MLGKSTTALVTFSGRTVPFYITCASGELRRTPYHHTTKVRSVFQQVGHRTDLCPTPDAQIGPTCSIGNAIARHACTPKCVLCQGPHPTAAKDCPKRLQPAPSSSHRSSRRDLHSHFRSSTRRLTPGQRQQLRSRSCTRSQPLLQPGSAPQIKAKDPPADTATPKQLRTQLVQQSTSSALNPNPEPTPGTSAPVSQIINPPATPANTVPEADKNEVEEMSAAQIPPSPLKLPPFPQRSLRPMRNLTLASTPFNSNFNRSNRICSP
ncbi:hypothetical protein HPB49_008206 [Dermacentor silvarum]|uniref:Uncharacterized protein n=1 Tax=Dermacentor silvarum TaxID=543639 RepID=A0ACB8C2N6_DERSI|nr:hypothetical protein HPB49_008206 [Dermacentor silvarum]